MLAAIAALAAGGAAWWGAGSSSARRRVALAVASTLVVASVALSVAAFITSELAPSHDAHASSVLALEGFQWLASAIALTMLGVAQVWAWLSPHDVRGLAVALNAGLMTRFAAASAVVVFVTVHLAPWLGR